MDIETRGIVGQEIPFSAEELASVAPVASKQELPDYKPEVTPPTAPELGIPTSNPEATPAPVESPAAVATPEPPQTVPEITPEAPTVTAASEVAAATAAPVERPAERTADEIARQAFDRSFGGIWNVVRVVGGYAVSGEAQGKRVKELTTSARNEVRAYGREAVNLLNRVLNGTSTLITESVNGVAKLGVEVADAVGSIPAMGIGALAETGDFIIQKADRVIDKVVDGGNAMVHEVAGKVMVRPFEAAAALVSDSEGFAALGALVEQANENILEPERQALLNGREAVGGSLRNLRKWLLGVVKRGNEYRQAGQNIRTGMAQREAGRKSWLAESRTYFDKFKRKPLSTLFGW